MRIAVIADTHNRFPESLLEHLKTADEIWHLGDVCDPGVLIELQQAGPPILAVRGNCDDDVAWPLTRTLDRGGLRFFLVHIPPLHPPKDCQVVLHGHTHVPRDEEILGVRFLNPGCITRPNRGAPRSFAFLEVDRGRLTWEPVRIT